MTNQTIAPQIIGDEELQTATGGFFWVAPVVGTIAGTAFMCSYGQKLSPGSTLELVVPYYASMAAAKAVMKSSN